MYINKSLLFHYFHQCDFTIWKHSYPGKYKLQIASLFIPATRQQKASTDSLYPKIFWTSCIQICFAMPTYTQPSSSPPLPSLIRSDFKVSISQPFPSSSKTWIDSVNMEFSMTVVNNKLAGFSWQVVLVILGRRAVVNMPIWQMLNQVISSWGESMDWICQAQGKCQKSSYFGVDSEVTERGLNLMGVSLSVFITVLL